MTPKQQGKAQAQANIERMMAEALEGCGYEDVTEENGIVYSDNGRMQYIPELQPDNTWVYRPEAVPMVERMERAMRPEATILEYNAIMSDTARPPQ